MSRIRFRERETYSMLPGTPLGTAWAKNVNGVTTTSTVLCDHPEYFPSAYDGCWDQTNPRPYIGGGPLRITHTGCNSQTTSINTWRKNYGYSGIIVGNANGPAYKDLVRGDVNKSALPDPEDLELDSSLGSTAWSKYRPGKPVYSLGVSLGELRDLKRSISHVKNSINFLRGLGRAPGGVIDQAASHYLGYQFGWKQVVNDLRSVISCHRKYDDHMISLRKNNGTWHNRGGTLSSGRNELYHCEGTDFNPIYPSAWNSRVQSASRGSYTTSLEERVWFVGRFRYYLPDLSRPEQVRDHFRKAMGLSLTPDLAWNLMPWSWLADWFANLGDIIANLNNDLVDDTVAQYAHVMHHRRYEQKCTWYVLFNEAYQNPGFGTTNIARPLTITGGKFAEVKLRGSASPFGFGVKSSDLTLRQSAIMAALGLSRF